MIMKRLVSFTAALLLLPGLCFAGTITSMSKDEVLNEFNDKTITTISAATLDGTVISDSFTGFFSKEGKMSGKFAKKPVGGEPQNDTGTWSVKSDGMLCFKWDNWDKGQEECIAVYKLDNGFLVINAENGFESFILKKDIVSGNTMSNSKH